jgi:hypothetical protein
MGLCNLRARPHPAGILLVLFCLSACGWEIPRRVEVSAAMGLRASLDIGELEDVREALAMLDINELSENFNKGGQQVTVYYYTGPDLVPLPDTSDPNKNAYNNLPDDDPANALDPGGVRTLLIHFPLTSINLNFTEYLKNDVTMPDVVLPDVDFSPAKPGESIPGEGFEIDPIPLGAMNEWIESIEINDEAESRYTTVTLEGGASLRTALKLAIPALGIGKDDEDYQFGTSSGADLVFTATYTKELHPRDPKEGIVHVNPLLVKVPEGRQSGKHYPVEIDLQWKEAEVNPGDEEDYSGHVSLPLGQFAEVLAKYKMVTLPHYLYVDGPFGKKNKARIGLQHGKEWIVGDKTNGAVIIENRYNFQDLYNTLESPCYNGSLSYASTASFNLAEKVNRIGGDLFLDYWIEVEGNWVVKYEDTKTDADTAIRVDLVALLPMRVRLEVAEEDTYESPDGRTFMRLVDMSDYGAGSASDLFGRDQADLAGSRITGVRISGNIVRNTIFAGDIFLRMYDDVSLNKLVKINAGKDFSIDIVGDSDIPTPFHPKFAVYLEEPENGSAVVDIKPKKDGEAESIKLVAEVTGEIEYERDL